MARSRVAVLKIAPDTVIDDYKRLMRLAGYQDFRPAGTPERLRSTFVSGYKHVPITARVRSTPRQAAAL